MLHKGTYAPVCSDLNCQCYALLSVTSLLLERSKEHMFSGLWSRVSLTSASPSSNLNALQHKPAHLSNCLSIYCPTSLPIIPLPVCACSPRLGAPNHEFIWRYLAIMGSCDETSAPENLIRCATLFPSVRTRCICTGLGSAVRNLKGAMYQ